MTDDQRERFEERAAIREYDAGMDRATAETMARYDVLVWGNTHDEEGDT